MKLSELTYSYLVSVGLPAFSMHTDASDELIIIHTPEALDRAKSELSYRYGDVNIIVNPDEDWFKQIVIDDPRWRADYEDYCNRKADWCLEHTSE